MKASDLKTKWIDFTNKMNRLGIPVPTARDPLTGKGSITAALLVFSAGLFGLCIVFMLASAIAKWAGAFVMTTEALLQVKTAADYSFQFLLAAYGGYLGRYFQKGESIDNLVQKNPIPKEIEKVLPKIDNPDQ
jgi:hypothetical protein